MRRIWDRQRASNSFRNSGCLKIICSSPCLLIIRLMDGLAKAEAARHHSGLELSAFSGRMGGDIAGNGDQDVTPGRALTPLPILLHASLEHLIGMEFGILAQHCTGKRRDQRLNEVTEDEITGNEVPRRLYGSLTIECSEKCIAQFASI